MATSNKLKRREFLRQSLAGAALLSTGAGSLFRSQAAYANDDYKALVFLFLDGGNDAYNMLVPVSGALRDRYDQGRGFIALPSQDLNPINLAVPANLSDGNTHSDFGFHPNASQLANLFNTLSDTGKSNHFQKIDIK